MKGKKYLLFVPVIILLSAPYYSHFLYAQDMPVQGSSAINQMQVYLKDNLTKIGLENVVWDFYKARENLPNFESACELKPGFKKSYLIFQNALRNKNFEALSFKNVEEYYQEVRHSFEYNKSNFAQCVSTMKKNNCLPPNLTPKTIIRSQMYYTFILLASNISEYKKAKQNKYIFPFCDLK